MPEVKPALMHYVAHDPTGPIKQTRRAANQSVGSQALTAVICSGDNLRVPCQPSRAYLSRGIGKGRKFRLLELFLATDQLFVERRGADGKTRRLDLITCPKCRASELYRRDVKAYEELATKVV